MKKKGDIVITRAEVDASTIDAAAKTFDVVFATETPVLRSPYWADETFNEVLVCAKKNMRTERLDAGVVPLLDTHNNYSVTGQYGIVRSWKIKDGECRATIQYSVQTGKADMWGDIEKGIIRSISVGAKVYQYERVGNSDPKKVPTYRAVDWEVLEISLAPVPLDYKSAVRSEGNEEYEIEILNYKTTKRSFMKPTEIKELRTTARAAGLDEDYIDDLISRCMGDDALSMDAARAEITAKKVPTPAPKGLTQEDVARAATEERTRSLEIRKLVRTQRSVAADVMTEEFADDMIGRGITLDAARTEILNKTAEAKPDGPVGGGGQGAHVGRDISHEMTMNAMIDGMMSRAMPGSVERFYSVKEAPATAKVIMRDSVNDEIGRAAFKNNDREYIGRVNSYRHMRFIDISRAMLTKAGVKNVDQMGVSEVANRALATSDLPDLFTSTIKRVLRQYYEPVVPEWAGYSRQVPADDFRVKTGIKFDAAVTFEEMDENGEYKESNLLSDEKATIQLQTYARKFSITRQTIINDDLGVLSDIPRAIGIGAKQFQSKKVWGQITGNALCPDGYALFHAKHGNLGTASVINDGSLSEARTFMRRQKSPQGNELMIVPKFLLVPPELQTVAQKQIRPINATQTSNVNIWEDLMPDVNVYLTDAKAWYMAAAPEGTTVDGIVHAYLTGEEGLFTESFIEKANDKLVIKARLDFATSLWGWQGWVKNAGSNPIIV